MWNNIKRFAGDRINDLKNAADTVGNEVEYRAKQLRDNAIVPVIDDAMESGLLRSDVGMFGRYLTGTSVPLTKPPADIKRDEQIVAERLGGLENNNLRRQQHARQSDAIAKSDEMTSDFNNIKRIFNEQQGLGINIKAHKLGLENYSPNQVAEYNSKERQIQELKKKHGGRITPLTTSNPARFYSDNQRAYAASDFVPFDENNYSNTDYKSESGSDAFIGATTNTLGQYSVKNGTAIDRYDFNHYTKDNYNSGGTITSATPSAHDPLLFLANVAGNAADKLGIITPESGYDVRLKLR